MSLYPVAPARVRRDGRVQAQGSPAEHATLGPAEEWLDRQARVIGQVAQNTVSGGTGEVPDFDASTFTVTG